MQPRPLILVSNDDGVHAVGIRELAAALRAWADVCVVAPEHEQSASSHRITLAWPLRHRELDSDIHAVEGTPADCVYVGLNLERLLPRRPDLVVSGINHGFNLGVDVIYSGTVAAAREAALRGVPAVAVSADPRADMRSVAEHVSPLVMRFLSCELPQGSTPLININYPATRPHGVVATRLGRRDYIDSVEARTDPRGRSYYWIGGPATAHTSEEGTDTTAVDRGYVSVTPLSLEMTQPEHLGLAAFVAGPKTEGEAS